ncbi:hypothetical protein KM043_002161 [Ampulex compressa]|nr:hypothetical protein KM043_002161 [Ampulex compressa]
MKNLLVKTVTSIQGSLLYRCLPAGREKKKRRAVWSDESVTKEDDARAREEEVSAGKRGKEREGRSKGEGRKETGWSLRPEVGSRETEMESGRELCLRRK